ncbi:MAG: bifunctional folylpolyglutamate synthase/dihydrofolate synthase [Muribaculaceae bacterium]|nr:bifunctional folylpolyglutamate synthase/dihydrofolate synthase [Muribaculaceae bacterium]
MDIDQKYKEAIEYLFAQLPMFSRTGAAAYKPGLETSLSLDDRFGNPHRKFKSIHVAGTNGKGSTSHSLASILQSAGYKTGLYTSPHLVDFRERMRINGEMIPKEEVIRFVDEWRATPYDGHPSFFELTMMMAFDWFAREQVDYAVIEVGMGGRLDSTNIITPEMCVITNISKDHTQFLGNTPEDIAREKAGIIKKGIPVIVGEASGSVRDVFEAKAASENTDILFAEDSPLLSSVEENEEGGWKGLWQGEEIMFPLSGDYQLKNLETVLHAVETAREVGISISDENVRDGLRNVIENTGLQGRWSILGHSPLIIADTGHNIAGMTYNIGQLRRLCKRNPDAKLHIVIGFVADKAIDEILRLLPKDATYYLTNASIPRALPADALKEKFVEAGLDGETYPDVKSAFKAACRNARKEDIVFVGGSTFIVADLLA